MNINMNNDQMLGQTLGLNISIQGQKNEAGQDTQIKGGKIYAGCLKDTVLSRTDEIKEKFKNQAREIVGKQRKNEMETANTIKTLKNAINELEQEIEAGTEDVNSMLARQEALREVYGIEPDSQEEKDLRLLEKSKDPMKILIKEERARLKEIEDHITPYQQDMLELSEAIKTSRKVMEGMELEIETAHQIIQDIDLANIKAHTVIDAYKAAEEVLKEGNKQTIQAAVDEAKDYIDEKLEANEKVDEAEEEVVEDTEEAADLPKQEEISELQKDAEHVKEEILALAKEAGIVQEDIAGLFVNQAL